MLTLCQTLFAVKLRGQSPERTTLRTSREEPAGVIIVEGKYMSTFVCVTMPTGSMWCWRGTDAEHLNDEATNTRLFHRASGRCNYWHIISDGHYIQRVTCLGRWLPLAMTRKTTFNSPKIFRIRNNERDEAVEFINGWQIKLNSRKETLRYTATQKNHNLLQWSIKQTLDTVVPRQLKLFSCFLLIKQQGNSIPK